MWADRQTAATCPAVANRKEPGSRLPESDRGPEILIDLESLSTYNGMLSSLTSTPAEDAEVVRRYRENPSPLVRDVRRGWRTGRLDLVLAGDFDLIPADERD